MNVTSKDILTRAVVVLKTHGWTKGKLSKWTGKGVNGVSYCSIGALCRATNEYGFHSCSEQFNHALEILEGACGTPAVASWNDHPDTTFDEVMNVFDLAIRRATV